MAAGGVFNPGIPMTRPGTYINIKSSRKPVNVYNGITGVVIIPLLNHSYGLTEQMIEFTADNIDSMESLIGYSLYSDNANVRCIKEAFKGCPIVKVYIANGSSTGSKATKTSGKITATAKYAGTRGNSISFSIVAEVDNTFTVNVYLDNSLKKAYKGITTIEDVVSLADPFIDFSSAEADKTSAVTAVANANLENGADGSTTNADISTFLDVLDSTYFTSVLFPVNAKTAEDDDTSVDAFVSKIKYLNKVGKNVVGVVVKKDADYSGIINVTNAPIVDGVTDLVATAAYVAGIYSGVESRTTNTNRIYDGATGFDKENILNSDKVEAAIKNGEFVFTLSDAGDVVVEYDINSLVNLQEGQDESFKKNKTTRIFAEICDRLKYAFTPGKFDVDETGFNLADGVLASILNDCQNEHIIKNVEDGDAYVDRTSSVGDALYINVAIQPVDSAEKIYITVITA